MATTRRRRYPRCGTAYPCGVAWRRRFTSSLPPLWHRTTEGLCRTTARAPSLPLAFALLPLVSAQGFEEFTEWAEEAAPGARYPDGEDEGEGSDNECGKGGGLGVEKGEGFEVGKVKGEAEGDYK